MSRRDETLLDLALSRTAIDRTTVSRSDDGAVARALGTAGTRVLPLHQGRAPVRPGHPPRLLLRDPHPDDAGRFTLLLGVADGTTYLAVLDDGPAPAAPGGDAAHRSLREVGADLDDADVGLLTTATALVEWHARHGHCPRCGTATEVRSGGWVRQCPRDGSEHYPRTDPAVIMAVTDGSDRLLMGTGLPWPEGRMSVLAGFVEAGESLEAAVAREVREEVGVRVGDIEYRGNQPWPFPASLMLGFRARALETDLHPDPAELRAARWFSRQELATALDRGEVTLPPRISIARRLIEEWYGSPLPPEPTGVPG